MAKKAKGLRITNSELQKRVVVKLDKTIKREDSGVNGLMVFGSENDYPQIVEKLINGSVTARAAASMYSRFLAGGGFENEALNNIQVGTDSRGKKITLRSLLTQKADSISYFNGYYLHCNFNLAKKITSVHLKSFKNCRFAKPDGLGYSAKVLYYDNWEKDKDVGRYDKKKIKDFNVFNVEDKAFKAQIENAGGIEKYKGQVFFQFIDNQYFYPLSPFDPSYLDCDTESQISLFKNRQIRNGFLNKIIMRVAPAATEEDKEEFLSELKEQLGADGDSVILLEDDIDPDTGEIQDNGAFKIDTVDTNVNPRLFDTWEKGLSNNIRKAVRGIPAVLIDYEESKLGTTSGEAITQATNFYNALTKDDREMISGAFAEVFANSDNPVLAENTNWNIKPLSLFENATTND